MNRWIVASCLALSLAQPSFSRDDIVTDANILTAIDESASVGRHGEWLQYNGLVAALTSREFLDVIRGSGVHGRIGFGVVAWSSHGNVRVVLPWMLIASEADAARAAVLLLRAPRADRSSWGDEDDTEASLSTVGAGTETDISMTIDATARLVVVAPFQSDRGVINILANGRDNVGSDPQSATQRAVSIGLTVNGVVFGGDRGLTDYFRRRVIGGAGAFVFPVDTDPRSFRELMVRKFLRDVLW